MNATNGSYFNRNPVSVTYINDCQAQATAETEEALLSWLKVLQHDETDFNNRLIAVQEGLEPKSCLLKVTWHQEHFGVKIQSVLQKAGIICQNLPFVDQLLQNTDKVYKIGDRSYKLLFIISDRGGFGDVFMAEDQESHEQVAIKILRNKTDLEHLQFRMLHNKGPHPNVVQYIGDGIINGRTCIVMEYISGQTLRQYVVTSQWTGELGEQYTNAIRFIREAGVTAERENAWSNIMITCKEGKPTVKVIDFGILATNF